MREQGLLFANYSLFWLTTVVLLGFQSTVWLQLFGYFPSPHLWIPVAVFWTIFRDPKESLFMTYLVGITVCTLSAIPVSLMLIVLVVLFASTYLLRTRIFWTGPTYFMMVCGLFTAFFPVVHLLASWSLEDTPIRDFLFFEWILRSLLTALFALPLYFLFSWIDTATHKEQPRDTGGQLI